MHWVDRYCVEECEPKNYHKGRQLFYAMMRNRFFCRMPTLADFEMRTVFGLRLFRMEYCSIGAKYNICICRL